MAGNEFQPVVAQANSAVTPTQGVTNTAAVDLFSTVAQVATDATFSYTGQQELSDLNKKFDRIVQARQAGGNSTALQIKARADLDTARANAPWISKEADQLFKDKFGGGSSGGVFKATPQEQAQADYLKKVEGVKLSRGLSSTEEAAKRIALEENAKASKIQADAQKEVRTYNGDLVFSNTQTQLNNSTVKFMDAINRANVKGGGSINSDGVRSFNLTIDQEVQRLKQELASQTRDANTGHLLVDKSSLEDNIKEIEDWATDTKAMVSDSSYTKSLQEINAEQSAEINLVAVKKYRTLKVLDAAGGQVAVNAYLKAAERKEGAAKQLLIGANPIAKDMFRQPGSFNQAGSRGLDKVFVPTPENILMSEQEALATGTMLNDPANAEVWSGVLKRVAKEPDAVEPYKSMIKKNPDSSAMLWNKKFKEWSIANPADAKSVLTHSTDALKTSFMSAYVSDNQAFPTDFQVVIGASTPSKTTNVTGGGLYKPSELPKNKVIGDGITPESASILFNMYKVFNNNPNQLKEVSSQAGVELTAEEAVKYTVLGSVPQSKEVKPTSDTNTKGSDKGASKRFTEDDLSFMIGNGEITEDDAILFRERGLVDG